jgi:hypothetical protein
MKRSQYICWWGVALLAAIPVWAQGGGGAAPVPVAGVADTAATTDLMLTPAPVSGEAYPVVFSSETKSNFLRGGVTFDSAYSDNIITGLNGQPVSDLSYSVWPTIAIDQTRPRMHWSLAYAPGFTFYQRNSGLDEADHNLALGFRYRLSPHVTLTASDGFQKSSSVFNQPDQGLGLGGGVSGAVGSDTTLIAPVADRLTNNGTAGLTYQFSANSMVGGSGTFMNLHYPNPSQVSGTNPALLGGLYDASSRAGTAFYSVRVSRKHYFGVAYQYQKLLSYPSGIPATDTETHAILAFYTLYATPAFSISFFGGPQYSSTDQFGLPTSQSWYPAAGGSLNWQERHTAAALSYSRMITSGGGLIGAAQSDNASASVRQLLTKNLSGTVSGLYSNKNVLTVTDLPDTSGHSIAGSVSLQRQFGEHVSLRAGYTRLRQVYRTVQVISPDTSREWISISYEFAKPLGR